MKLYINSLDNYTEISKGLVSLEADLSHRCRQYPFIDGDRTQMMNPNTTVKAVINLMPDIGQTILINAALSGERTAFRFVCEGYSRDFEGTVNIERIYYSRFYGTEMTVTITQ